MGHRPYTISPMDKTTSYPHDKLNKIHRQMQGYTIVKLFSLKGKWYFLNRTTNSNILDMPVVLILGYK